MLRGERNGLRGRGLPYASRLRPPRRQQGRSPPQTGAARIEQATPDGTPTSRLRAQNRRFCRTHLRVAPRPAATRPFLRQEGRHRSWPRPHYAVSLVVWSSPPTPGAARTRVCGSEPQTVQLRQYIEPVVMERSGFDCHSFRDSGSEPLSSTGPAGRVGFSWPRVPASPALAHCRSGVGTVRNRGRRPKFLTANSRGCRSRGTSEPRRLP
jgi:hypothetical protein